MKPGAGMVGSRCLVAVLWLLAACAQSGERAPARAPASAEAEEAPARPIATSLASDPLSEPEQKPEEQSEQHHGMHHVAHRHDHAVSPASGASDTQSAPTVYTCPMHPEVQQAGPGECPKCGMKLVPSTKPAPQSSQEAQPAHEHAN